MLLQVITFTGKTIPAELLDMYLAVLGSPFMAGGQTSVYGININNHIVGVFGGLFEQAINSPYELLKKVVANHPETVNDKSQLSRAVYNLMADVYQDRISTSETARLQEKLIATINQGEVPDRWPQAREQVADYFTRYFD